MAKMKFGVGDDVSTESGFAPYEGPLPKPGVVYPVRQRSAVMRKTGSNSQKPGTEYVNSMWEITDGECKGYTTFHRVVPGDSEIQQIRVAQYMQAVCGKNSAPVVYDEVEDGGKIKAIGGKDPVGVTAGATFKRVKETYGVPEGEEAPWTAEINDLIPGWKPKGAAAKAAPVAEPEPEDDEDLDEEFEEEDEEIEEEDDSDEEDEDAAEDENEDSDSDEGDEPLSFEDAAKLSLVELKTLAKQYEYEDGDLNPFKGPAGKKKLLAQLVEDEVVAAPADSEPPF